MSGEVRLWRVDSGDGTQVSLQWWGGKVIDGVVHGRVVTEYIALPAAEFDAWRRVMLAARCWRDTVIFPNEENGSEVDLCAALDALPSNQQPGRAGGGA